MDLETPNISKAACTDDQVLPFKCKNPSQATFEQLLSIYSYTLQRPCSSISIPYGQFISILRVYHQLCSSIFIDDQWILYINDYFRAYYMQLDFRATSTSLFQFIRTLCQIIQANIQDELDVFEQAGTFISPNVLSSKTVSAQIQVLIAQFQLAMPSKFLRTLLFVRDITEGN
ncbi:unnamed protein product [Rotaria sordida]|uniref:Uncharacterized protein n=1 Tax=Rotaria sordida TaxID=392033 RepID=A0A819A119_9BILA|nr:unnamed protein product [Rotaria sordida]